jgi:GNAT superfamily N-acetyltransferase
MMDTNANKRVWMVRNDLDNLPHFDLPAGFSIRWYQPGDEEHWLRIHLLADKFNKFSSSTFFEIFGHNQTELASRICYLLDAKQNPVGTATAWFDNNFEGQPFGRIHWVAIVPNLQGHGAGKGLVSAICTRLTELGHQRAYLRSSTGRLPAINLYLKFGFVPLIRNVEDEADWNLVRAKLANLRR